MGANAKRVAAKEAEQSAAWLKATGGKIDGSRPYEPGESAEQTAARSAYHQRQSAWTLQQARQNGDPIIHGMQQIRGNYGLAPADWQPGGGATTGGGAGIRAGAMLGGAGGDGNTAVNTAAADPLLQSAIKTFQDRAKADNTKRATDRVFGAAKGGAAALNNDLDAQMARRGIGGSGLDARARTQVSEAAARAAAGGAANIQLGQQDRLDRLAQAGTQVAMMPANLALQQQGLGIQQLSLQNQAQNQQAQLAMQQQAQQQAQQQQQMQNWLALMNAGFF